MRFAAEKGLLKGFAIVIRYGPLCGPMRLRHRKREPNSRTLGDNGLNRLLQWWPTRSDLRPKLLLSPSALFPNH